MLRCISILINTWSVPSPKQRTEQCTAEHGIIGHRRGTPSREYIADPSVTDFLLAQTLDRPSTQQFLKVVQCKCCWYQHEPASTIILPIKHVTPRSTALALTVEQCSLSDRYLAYSSESEYSHQRVCNVQARERINRTSLRQDRFHMCLSLLLRFRRLL